MHVEPGTAEALVGYLDSMKFWSQVDVTEQSSYAVLALPAGATPPPGVVAPHHPLRRRSLRAPGRHRAVRRRGWRPGGFVGVRGVAHRRRSRAARASRPTTGRSPTRSAGWRPPSISTRAAIAGRRRSRGCTTSVGRRGGWCCCTSTAANPSCPRPASPVTLDGREVGRVTSSARHYELGPIALAVVKRSTDAGAAAGRWWRGRRPGSRRRRLSARIAPPGLIPHDRASYRQCRH